MGHDAVAEPALPRPVPVPSTASACGYTPWLGLARVGRPNVPRARRQKRGKPRGRGGVKYTLHSDVHTGWGLMMPTCPDMPPPAGLRWRRRPSLPAGMPPGRAHAAWLGPRCPRRGGTGGASLRRPAPAPVDGRRRRGCLMPCRLSTTLGSAVAPRTTRPGLCGPRPDVGSTAGASTPHARRTRGGLWCGAPPRRRAGAAGGPGQVIPHRDHPGGFASPSGRVRRLMRARHGPREAGLGVGRPRRGATRRAGSPWYINVL